METRECLRGWKAHDSPIADMAIDPTGCLLATASADRTIRVWDIAQGFCTHAFRGHEGIVTRVLFHPHAGNYQLFSASEDATARIWDLNKRSCTAVLKSHFSVVTSLAVSIDGLTLVTAGRDKIFNLWDTRTGALKSTVPVYEAIEGICILSGNSGVNFVALKYSKTNFKAYKIYDYGV